MRKNRNGRVRTGNVVEGNVVRKDAHDLQNVHLIRRKKTQSKALIRQKRRLTLLGIAAGSLFTALCVLLLFTLSQNTSLSSQISSCENKIESLTVANDAKEYEINSSVDLNYVINVATAELGMVRSSLSQVVTFGEKDSEYLHQVALLPTE